MQQLQLQETAAEHEEGVSEVGGEWEGGVEVG